MWARLRERERQRLAAAAIKTGEHWTRFIYFAISEGVTVYTLFRCLFAGQTDGIQVCVITALLLCLPRLFEMVFHCHIRLPLYLFLLFYAQGELFGHCWKLFYTTRWWDKFLHFSAGVVFAVVPLFFVRRFLHKHRVESLAFSAAFALLFSISAAATWEFFEFGADRLFGQDMQNDRLVDSFNSYNISDETGKLVRLDHIDSVVINGEIELDGYLDIGLIDTMGDMMVASAGALLFVLIFLCAKGRGVAIDEVRPPDPEDEAPLAEEISV